MPANARAARKLAQSPGVAKRYCGLMADNARDALRQRRVDGNWRRPASAHTCRRNGRRRRARDIDEHDVLFDDVVVREDIESVEFARTATSAAAGRSSGSADSMSSTSAELLLRRRSPLTPARGLQRGRARTRRPRTAIVLVGVVERRIAPVDEHEREPAHRDVGARRANDRIEQNATMGDATPVRVREDLCCIADDLEDLAVWRRPTFIVLPSSVSPLMSRSQPTARGCGEHADLEHAGTPGWRSASRMQAFAHHADRADQAPTVNRTLRGNRTGTASKVPSRGCARRCSTDRGTDISDGGMAHPTDTWLCRRNSLGLASGDDVPDNRPGLRGSGVRSTSACLPEMWAFRLRP